jgi:hypothetical protein
MGTKDQIQAAQFGNLGTHSQPQLRRFPQSLGENFEMPMFSSVFDERTGMAQGVQRGNQHGRQNGAACGT